MGINSAYRKRRAALTAAESVATLTYMESYFANGANWTQNLYASPDGAARCLVGAADHVRVTSIDDAKFWLRQAIAERYPAGMTIEEFNDGARSYDEIAAVIARAKQLAAPVVEILPPVPVPTSGEVTRVLQRAGRIAARRRSLADWSD
jgi:hypothetical protein